LTALKPETIIQPSMAGKTKGESTVNKEPRVEIFGEELSPREERLKNKGRYHEARLRDRFHYYHRHHHYGSLTWGLVLILIGLVLLLSNFGSLPPVVWEQISRLWPLLIIFIGLDILIGYSVIADITKSIIGLFIFATILGIVLLHASPQTIAGLPPDIQNYLFAVNNFFQIR
jgi:hypothetical protein